MNMPIHVDLMKWKIETKSDIYQKFHFFEWKYCWGAFEKNKKIVIWKYDVNWIRTIKSLSKGGSNNHEKVESANLTLWSICQRSYIR